MLGEVTHLSERQEGVRMWQTRLGGGLMRVERLRLRRLESLPYCGWQSGEPRVSDVLSEAAASCFSMLAFAARSSSSLLCSSSASISAADARVAASR